MAIITTKFAVGDRAFYAVFATATIYAITVKHVWYDNGIILYTVERADTGDMIENVPESSVCFFSEAKESLQAYLQKKLNEVSVLVAP